MIYLNKKYIAFIVGLFSVTQVRLVGTFAIGEFLIFIGIVYLLIINPRSFRMMFRSNRMNTLLILCFFWICSIFFSDQINETGIVNSLKGGGGVVPLFLGFIFFYWLLRENTSLLYFFIFGAAISAVISLYIFVPSALESRMERSEIDSLAQTGSLWYRLVASTITGFITVFSFKYYPKYPHLVALICLINAFHVLLQGSRGEFLLVFVASILLFYFSRYSKVKVLNDVSIMRVRKKLPVMVLLIIACIFSARYLYTLAAEKGYMGEEQKGKYEKQSSSKMGLLSGRGEFVAAYLAIRDSPWLGHGSYALDEKGYGYQASEITGDFSDWQYDRQGELYIPTHSHLTGAWVQSGLMGGFFWVYVLFLLILFLLKYVYVYPVYLGYSLFATLLRIWAILFAPFSERIQLSIFLVFIIILMDQKDKRQAGSVCQLSSL